MHTNDLLADYPYPIEIGYTGDNVYYPLWHNFLISVEYDQIDNILDTKYNAVRTSRGLRFKSGSERLMFVLRFS